MNWKKFFKYTAATIFALLLMAMFWAGREGNRMYGAYTQVVDHEQFQPETGTFAIQNINVLAPNGADFIAQQTVLIEAGKITTIAEQVALPTNAKIIDGTGKYLIPGLIDAHVHLFQSPNDLLLYIANGVTEIRELIGSDNHLAWKKEIEQGRVGPKMFVASPRLGSFSNLEGFFMEQSQGFRNVQDAEQARQIVQEYKDRGYDGLKIYSHLNQEAYVALTETAKELDMPTFGHIPFVIGFDQVWNSGQSDIAHFEEIMNALQREFSHKKKEDLASMFGGFMEREEAFLAYTEQRSNELADSLIAHDISVTSTLWLTQSFARQKVELDRVLTEIELAYENPGISEGTPMVTRALGWLPHVNRYRFYDGITENEKVGNIKYWQAYGDACQLIAKNFAQKGVKIMAGTDANLPPTVPGFSLHDELISLKTAGMTTAQVLQSATATPANWLKSNTGQIATGYAANLVLLDKNPLEDISNTKAINTVIANGKVYDRSLLDQMLAAVKAVNDASRTIEISQYEKEKY
ncbi:MAG: amidohydrolase family protein [Saprospiraceae bacterium]